MILGGDEVPRQVRESWFKGFSRDSLFMEGNYTIRVADVYHDGERARLRGKILDGSDLTFAVLTVST